MRFLPKFLLRSAPSEASLQPQISAFWAELEGRAFSPTLIQFLWVSERCIQLVAQNISVMPLRFKGAALSSVEPAWLSNPDPTWFPNGIADALFAGVDDYYRYGDIFLYVNSYYASGFPSGWSVYPASTVGVEFDGRTGRRKYDLQGEELDPTRVIQISRNPRGGLRGTSAFKSYADVMSGSRSTTIAAADAISNTPLTIVKPNQKINPEQAAALQAALDAAARTRRPGSPIVLDPRLDLEGSKLGFTPEEMMLVDVQEYWARVLGTACGVPPFLLNIALSGGLTYQNPAMLGEYWWRTELFGTCSRIARALTAQALPAGSSVFFDPGHLTQPLTEQGNADESPAVKASPSDQSNVTALRPQPEVMS